MHNKFGRYTWTTFQVIVPTSKCYTIKYNKTHDTCIWHHYHAKFKMAAMKSLKLSYIFISNWDRNEIFSPKHMFSVSRSSVKRSDVTGNPVNGYSVKIMLYKTPSLILHCNSSLGENSLRLFEFHRIQLNTSYIYSASLSCKIQNGRYEITEVIIYLRQ